MPQYLEMPSEEEHCSSSFQHLGDRRCFLHLSHSWNETCLGIKSRMRLVLSLLGRLTALDSPDQLRPCNTATHHALSHFCVSRFLISCSPGFPLSFLESQPPCQPHFLYLPLNKCWDSQGFSSRLSSHLLTLITNTCCMHSSECFPKGERCTSSLQGSSTPSFFGFRNVTLLFLPTGNRSSGFIKGRCQRFSSEKLRDS